MQEKSNAYQQITNPKAARVFAIWLICLLLLFVVLAFLPWTQNIGAYGKVTTLTPQDRPQEIQSIIDGRIEKWFVKEGDLIKEGDTIVFLSEVKEQYWDPQLLKRTREQIEAKEGVISSYQKKVEFLEGQIQAEKTNLNLKLKQANNKIIQFKNKLRLDSAEVTASEVNAAIAKEQLTRGEQLFKDGLISLVQLEARKNKLQETAAKLVSAESKLAITQNDLLNAIIELNTIEREYISKIYKVESDIQSTNSDMFKTDEELSKLNNQYSNFEIRSGNYYVLAPKNGQVVKLKKAGIGENVKQGEAIASITSSNPNLGIELYVMPNDLPLLVIGSKARLIFDGWPTIVFSGWPNASTGTFGGKVAAIDSDISPNGKYRILIAPDEQWPPQIRVGSGARGLLLLNEVPVWYELWRQLNGFPPDFYSNIETVAK